MKKKRADKMLDPIPPGEILLEEFMKPLGISINRLARDIDVPPGRISQILREARHDGGYRAQAGKVFWCFAGALVEPTGGLRYACSTPDDLAGHRASHQRSSGGLKVRMWRMPWARRWG